jgi:cardiolipin synthase
LENRRPQATLAWALAFFFMPGLGLLIYFFFGRGWKPFAKQRQLLLQGLKGTA